MAPLRCANAPLTARSFLRLANRNYYSTSSLAQSSAAPLEFLVPRAALRSTASKSPSSTKLRAGRGNCFYMTPTSSRHFSVSAIRRATVCVQNPVKDEDGNEMMLEITPRAAKRLSQIMKKDANPDLALRIQVESGGCHGFQYLMSLVTIPEVGAEGSSEVVREDDTIFQFAGEEGEEATPNPPKIILDEPSLELLKGSKVDFTMELIGSQFKIVDNPYATTSCGCGTSFDIKM